MVANDATVVQAAVQYANDAGITAEILKLVPSLLVP